MRTAHAFLESRAARAVLALVVLAAVLEMLSAVYGLPSVPEVLNAMVRQAKSGTLFLDVAVSLTRWSVGFLCGATLGITLGLSTGRVRVLCFVLEGFLTFLRGVPFIALLPLTLYIFGIGETGKAFLIAWVSFVTSWIIVHVGASRVSELIEWKLQVLGVPTLQKITRVIVPSLNGDIYTAIRTSVSYALIAVAVAEMSGVRERTSGYWLSEGLGYRIFRSYEVTDFDAMVASIVVFGLVAIGLDRLFTLSWDFGAYVRRWYLERRARRVIDSVKGDPAQMPNDKKPLLIRNLSAGHRSKAVVRSASISVPAGGTLVVVGPSGCGKTTLLRAVGGFMSPDFGIAGEVHLGGTPLKRSSERIGVVFQDASVFGHMTAWDNALFGIPAPTTADLCRTKEMFKRFGLLKDAHRLADTFSGGQRQRLAIACALAYCPHLLLLDEPFGALDAITRRTMQEFYFEEVKGRVTTLFVTHDIGEAVLLGDTVMVGVAADAPCFSTSSEMRPEIREFSAEFGEQKKLVADAIRAEYERSW